MLSNSYYKVDELVKLLDDKLGLCKLTSNNKEITCRCPYPNCDVELDKKNHGHLYISLSDGPVFFCHRCNETGSIFKLFEKIGVNPKEYINEDHPAFKQKGNYKDTSGSMEDSNIDYLDIEKVREDELPKEYRNKVEYLKGRLGFDFSIDRIPRLVINIRDFINRNNIELDQETYRYIDYYDQNCVGFIGSRGFQLILRFINDSKYRYKKIPLMKNEESRIFKDFYGFHSQKLSLDNNNTIVLAEGIFDILTPIFSSSENILEIKDKVCYWASAFGAYYKNLVPSVLDYLKLPQANFIILSDSDKKPDNYIYKFLREGGMVKSFELYYNKNEKDFGVSNIKPIKHNRFVTKGKRF